MTVNDIIFSNFGSSLVAFLLSDDFCFELFFPLVSLNQKERGCSCRRMPVKTFRFWERAFLKFLFVTVFSCDACFYLFIIMGVQHCALSCSCWRIN